MPSCKICGKSVPTTKGLRFHIVQRQECREGMRSMARHRAPVAHEANSVKDNLHSSDTPLNSHDQDNFDLPDGLDPPLVDFDVPRSSPTPDPLPDSPPDRRARVEDVEDEGEEPSQDHIPHTEDYPRPAGTRLRRGECHFEQVKREQESKQRGSWAPFEDEEEWGLAEWLLLNVGQNATDKFLKLPIVSNQNSIMYSGT